MTNFALHLYKKVFPSTIILLSALETSNYHHSELFFFRSRNKPFPSFCTYRPWENSSVQNAFGSFISWFYILFTMTPTLIQLLQIHSTVIVLCWRKYFKILVYMYLWDLILLPRWDSQWNNYVLFPLRESLFTKRSLATLAIQCTCGFVNQDAIGVKWNCLVWFESYM